MAIKKIPAREIMICDRCGKESDEKDRIPFSENTVIKASHSDVAYGTTEGVLTIYDLCDTCTTDFVSFLTISQPTATV